MPESTRSPVIAAVCAAVTAAPSVGLLAEIAGVDPYELSASAQVDLLVGLERHSAWLGALTAKAMAAVAGQDPARVEPDPADPITCDPFAVDDPVREEIASALHVSGMAADRRMAVARDLAHRLTLTYRLLEAGTISYGHAVVMSEETEHLSDADTAIVEAHALVDVDAKTPGQLRRRARAGAARVAPRTRMQDVQAEFARREVRLDCDGGVMATITACLPAPDAVAVWNALTGCALTDTNDDLGPGDTHTLGHRRADALTAWAHHALDDPDLPTVHRRRRLETHIVVDLATLLGLADDPAELVGYGPIPPSLARHLSADSQWRRLVTDPVDGYLLDYGHTRYTPPTHLRDYLLARDRTCTFPGCGQPSTRCDLDHINPYTGSPEGGTTSAANLHPLCRRHHKLKTHHNWHIHTNPDNPHQNIWTSPRGKTYKTSPRAKPEETNLETNLKHTLQAA